MSNSNTTYEDRIGKFKGANVIIQAWGDYAPNSPLITKAALNTFITSVETANNLVTTREEAVGQKKRDRVPLVFAQYDPNSEVGITNPDCAQQRIIGVHTYVKSIFPQGSKKTDLLKEIVDKVRPQYKGATSDKSFSIPPGGSITVNNAVNSALAKNTGTTNVDWSEPGGPNPPETVNPGEETTILSPSGTVLLKNLSTIKAGKFRMKVKTGKTQSKSPSEKTFASMEGFMSEVIIYVSAFGGGIVYSPPDPKLTVAELTSLHGQIVTINGQVNSAMDIYGDTNRGRKTLYDGLNGMTDRIAMIRNYLASFPGKKKSNHYIEFVQAIKGT